MIYYGKQTIDQADIRSVVDVLKGKYLTQGPMIFKFEDILKKKFGSKYCCVLSSGTGGLHLTGIALGWKKGDIVLSSPTTFLA